jgi:hypothetical protein
MPYDGRRHAGTIRENENQGCLGFRVWRLILAPFLAQGQKETKPMRASSERLPHRRWLPAAGLEELGFFKPGGG